MLYAADKGQLVAVQTLIRHGAGLDLSLTQGETALVQDCFRQHLDVALELIRAGAIAEAIVLV